EDGSGAYFVTPGVASDSVHGQATFYKVTGGALFGTAQTNSFGTMSAISFSSSASQFVFDDMGDQGTTSDRLEQYAFTANVSGLTDTFKSRFDTGSTGVASMYQFTGSNGVRNLVVGTAGQPFTIRDAASGKVLAQPGDMLAAGTLANHN